MNDLLLHPVTAHHLSAFLAAMPHAICIVGPAGSGKEALALQIISGALGSGSSKATLEIKTQNGAIGINDIRQIRDYLKRRTAGKAAIRRAILIPEAHTMSIEAQNALLKTLEEPPADAMIVLTAADITQLQPTIRSRSQQFLVMPVGIESARAYFTAHAAQPAKVETAYFMSEGRVGLMRAIIENNESHPLFQAIQSAKKLLQQTSYERLIEVDNLSKQKEQTNQLLEGLERVTMSGLRQAANAQKPTPVKKFYTLSQNIHIAKERLHKNANAKLVLTNLFMVM
jgi:DNA polymerase III subunit delta'